jgi:transcriptional regulator with XRE-family HTH domain
MLTPLGKELRKLRIDDGLLLKDVADALDVSVAWLSAIETGRKTATNDIVNKLANHFGLDTDQRNELHRLAEISRTEFKIKPARDADENRRDMAAVLARRFDDLSDEAVKKITRIILGGEGDKRS